MTIGGEVGTWPRRSQRAYILRMANAILPWRCEICNQPINSDGAVEFDDARSREMPGYDPDAPEHTEAIGDRGEILFAETSNLQTEAALRMLDDPGVRFHVWHFDCAPATRSMRYQIPCDRATRIEDWTAWTEHLWEKNWMKRREFIAMMRVWCAGHGLTVPDSLP